MQHDLADHKDLVLDPAIRDFVLLPLILLVFLFGILRHNAAVLLKGAPKAGDQEQVKQRNILQRSKLLRMNGKHIPLTAFAMRRHHFINETDGVLNQKIDSQANMMAMMSDPDMMQNMLRGNVLQMLPQLLLMGLINQFFQGFLLIKLPFALTPSFKAMLQRGIPLATLDVSYVTSLSWVRPCQVPTPFSGRHSHPALLPSDAVLSAHVRPPGPFPAGAR